VSLAVSRELDGAVLRLSLDAGKGNIVDAKMVAALSKSFAGAEGEMSLRAVLLDAKGNDFSFGASVEEHLPDHCAEMLGGLHALIKQMLRLPVPVICAVKGRCLGGGLELALACSRIVAHPTAKLGNPEVKLAVFAPAASALLPWRVGNAAAEDLLVTGRTVGAGDALAMKLVDEVCAEDADPSKKALEWVQAHLMELSRSSLRFAVRAAREGWSERAIERLNEVEKLYLESLMATDDAKEGITAFVEKRKPVWKS